MMKDYRILPGTGKATIATLCDFYQELRGGQVKEKGNSEPCKHFEMNEKLGYCTHYFCLMCRYIEK